MTLFDMFVNFICFPLVAFYLCLCLLPATPFRQIRHWMETTEIRYPWSKNR